MRPTTFDFSAYIADRTRDFVGREWVFAEIDRWLADRAAPRFFILAGEPGIGKTAIAARLAQIRDLDACHFCIARQADTVDPLSFTRFLSHQLTHIDDFAQNLLEGQGVQVEVHVDVRENHGQLIGMQIENLIVKAPSAAIAFNRAVLDPLQQLYDGGFDRPLLILVDALDEAVQHRGPETIVDLLANAHGLPPRVRFVLTSRPAEEALRHFERLDIPHVLLAAGGAKNEADVRTYIRHRLETSDRLRLRLAEEVVEPDAFVQQATEASRGSFLYLVWLLRSVEDGMQLLDTSEGFPEGLDGIYREFLRTREVGKDIREWRNQYRALLGVLAAAQEPLTAEQLRRFTGLSAEEVEDSLLDVQQFLDPVQAKEGLHGLYHQSLVDFLSNKEQAQEFWIDLVSIHNRLANHYLDAWGGLEAELSGLEEPEEPGLGSQYGIRHLAAHLQGAERYAELDSLVSKWWAELRFACECTYEGFLSDLRLAWKVADQQGPEGIGRQIRYALMQSSVLSQGPIRTDSLVALVLGGAWTLEQGLSYARSLPDIGQRAEALAGFVALLMEQGLSEEADPVANEAWEAIGEMDSWEDAPLSLFALAPYFSPGHVSEALDLVRACGRPEVRAELGIALLPHLPDDKQDSLQQSTLQAIRQLNQLTTTEITSPIPRVTAWPRSAAQIIARLVIDVPAEEPAAHITRKLREARQTGSSLERVMALAELISLVPKNEAPDLIAQMLHAARESHSDWIAALAVVKYALPWLLLESKGPSSVARECLQTAKGIGDARTRRLLLLVTVISTQLLSPLSRVAVSLGRRLGWTEYLSKRLRPSSIFVTRLGGVRLELSRIRRKIALTALDISWKLTMRFELVYLRTTVVKYAKQVYLLIKLVDSLSSTEKRLPVLAALANTAREIEDPTARAVILARLLHHLPLEKHEEILTEISVAFNAISNAHELAQTYAEILRYSAVAMPKELLTRLTDPYIRAKVIARRIPYLGEGERVAECEEVLQAIEEMGDREHYYKADALVGLAGRLHPETGQKEILEEALRLTRRVHNADVRAELLGRAIAVGPVEDRLELRKEAVAAALAIQNTPRRAQALVALTSLLPDSEQLPFLTEHWHTVRALGAQGSTESAMTVGTEPLWLSAAWEAFRLRVVVLSQLSSGVLWGQAASSPNIGAEHDHILLTDPWICTGTDVWCGLLKRLLPHIPTQDRTGVFSKIRENMGEASLNAQLALTPFVPADQRTDWLAATMRSARQVPDPQTRADALRMLARHFMGDEREGLISEALAAAAEVDQESHRALVLRWMIPLLLPQLWQEALQIIGNISEALDRSELLIEMARCMPKEHRAPVLDEALKAAYAIEDAAPFQVASLTQLIPMLTKEKRPKALRRALGAVFAEPPNASVSVSEFGRDVSGRAVGQIQLLFGLFDWRFNSGSAFRVASSIITMLSVSDPVGLTYHARLYRSPLGESDLRIYTTPQLLSTLAPFLPAPLVDRAIDKAQSIENPEECVRALGILSQYLSENEASSLVSQVVELAGTIEDRTCRARSLHTLALKSPGDDREPILKRAWDAALSIQDSENRLLALSEIALSLPPDLQEKAWSFIGSEGSVRGWSQTLSQHGAAKFAQIGPDLPDHLSYRLWLQVLHALSGLPRSQFLSALDALIPVYTALGRQRAADETVDALLEILAMWP